MKFTIRLFITYILLPSLAYSQKDTLIKKLDSTSKVQTDTSKNVHNNIKQENYNEVTKITAHTYFVLLESDIKQQVSAPFHIKQKDYPKIAAFAVITGGLIWTDESINQFAVNLRNNSSAVVDVSKYTTRFGAQYEVAALLAMGSY